MPTQTNTTKNKISPQQQYRIAELAGLINKSKTELREIQTKCDHSGSLVDCMGAGVLFKCTICDTLLDHANRVWDQA